MKPETIRSIALRHWRAHRASGGSRRDLILKSAGAVGLLLGSRMLPGCGGDVRSGEQYTADVRAKARKEEDDGRRTDFHFDCQVKGPLAGGVQHFLAMAGCGSFNDAEVEGVGGFLHIDFNSRVPKTIFASGSWRARRLVSFQPFGRPYGVFQAGIAQLEIDLVRTVPSRLIVPATLRIVCNIGPAGPASDTGLPESVVLHADGLTFDQPVAGLTVFTIRAEENLRRLLELRLGGLPLPS